MIDDDDTTVIDVAALDGDAETAEVVVLMLLPLVVAVEVTVVVTALVDAEVSFSDLLLSSEARSWSARAIPFRLSAVIKWCFCFSMSL